MKVCVCFHDQCFDGASAAAVFTRFYRGRINPQAEFHYRGLVHRAGQLFDANLFQGDENVIVDFKYCSSERLTWWFDHHQSAFLTEADAEHFRRDRSGKKFYAPEFKSCTKFVAYVAETQFGFVAPDLQELIHWADVIDGAQYPDARSAVEMLDPATQLTLVIEGVRTPGFAASLIPLLATRSLAEIMALPHIRRFYAELYQRHLSSIQIIRERAEMRGKVVYYDITDQEVEGGNKFVPYYLFPEAVYSVALSQSADRIKIAVGSSPWNVTPKSANLATMCEKYGGGGHAKVAAISLPPHDLAYAREVANRLAAELQSAE